MIVVKNKALIIVLVLLSAGISGYEVYQRYFTEEEPRFQWPDKIDIPCQPTSESFDCDVYLQANSTPVKTLLHPLNDEVWVAELDGKISSWDGSPSGDIVWQRRLPHTVRSSFPKWSDQ